MRTLKQVQGWSLPTVARSTGVVDGEATSMLPCPTSITAVYCCNATQRRMINKPLVQSLCCSCLPWEFGHTRDNAAPKYRVLFESPRLAAGSCKIWGEAVPSHMLNTMTVGAGMEQPLDAKHHSHEIRQRGMSHCRAPEESKVYSAALHSHSIM